MQVKQKTSRFQRSTSPSPMRLQQRDGEIFQAIHRYDGILARRQIKAMFWPRSTTQALERRLSLLYHNGFLNWPNTDQRRTKPIPEPVVWLGWRGILFIAHQLQIDVPFPNNPGENQMRSLEKRLREEGIGWQREPRWRDRKSVV